MPEWKELWRPFLEVAPEKLKPIEEIMSEGIALGVPEIDRSPAQVECDERREWIITRALKLWAHYCNQSDIMQDLLTNQLSISWDHIMKAVMHHGTQSENPDVRQNSIFVLGTFCAHECFLTWCTQHEQQAAQVSALFLQRLKDDSIQVSEMAMECTTRWITAAPLLSHERYQQWKQSILDASQLGKKLGTLLDTSAAPAQQIVLTNLVIELTCPSTAPTSQQQAQGVRSDPFAPGENLTRHFYRGRAFVHQYELASEAILYLGSSDRILRFRVVEMLEQLTKHHHHFLFLPRDWPPGDDMLVEQQFLLITDHLVASHSHAAAQGHYSLFGMAAQLAGSLTFKHTRIQ